MLALFRVLKNLRDREHYLRTRYHRAHPHFLLYIALDAIITVAIFGGGYALASTHGIIDRNPAVLADLGAVPLNLSELKGQVSQHGQSLYWIGQLSSFKYATEFVGTSAGTIRYVTSKSSNVALGETYLRIQTFSNSTVSHSATHGPIRAVSDVTLTNSRNDRVTYNPTALHQATVHIHGRQEVVVMSFASPQNPAMLMQTSERLRLLS